jgi:hypothetical protein
MLGTALMTLNGPLIGRRAVASWSLIISKGELY